MFRAGRCGQVLQHVIGTFQHTRHSLTHNSAAAIIFPGHGSPLGRFSMSHQKKVSLNPHDLWGVLKGDNMSQNGAAAGPDSSPPGSNTAKRPVSPTTSKKVPGKSTKEMSTQAAPAAHQAPKSLPDFMLERNELFDQLKREYDQELASRNKPAIQIKHVPAPGQ